MHRSGIVTAGFVAALAWVCDANATPLGTSVTYQGRLKNNGQPANGAFNLTFTLWDAAGAGTPPVGGTQIGGTDNEPGVVVAEGLFTVQLNDTGQFGLNAFNGDARWVQIAVNGTTLAPRQPLTAAPYAMYALSGPGQAGFWAANGLNINNTNSGNVGIGTTTPNAKLDIRRGFLETAPALSVRQFTTSSAFTAVTIAGSSIESDGNAISDNPLRLNPTTTNSVLLAGGGGNVGIGTDTPTSALHVSGSENNGTQAATRIVSGSQAMLLDGNEIDTLSSIGLYLNNNVPHNIVLANGGGSVGIGTTTPTARLEVVTQDDGNSSTSSYAISAKSLDPQGYAARFSGYGLFGNGPALSVTGDTRMIGTLMLANLGPDVSIPVPAGVKLAVDGKIMCEELEVQLSQDWPDYVFEHDYDLMPLSEVDAFIQREKHLPGIPSAEEIKREGLSVGQMQADMLRKIEELTLHMIAMDRQLGELKRENELLRRQLDSK